MASSVERWDTSEIPDWVHDIWEVQVDYDEDQWKAAVQAAMAHKAAWGVYGIPGLAVPAHMVLWWWKQTEQTDQQPQPAQIAAAWKETLSG